MADSLEAKDSSGPSAGALAAIAATEATGALALGGAAWFARRRVGKSLSMLGSFTGMRHYTPESGIYCQLRPSEVAKVQLYSVFTGP